MAQSTRSISFAGGTGDGVSHVSVGATPAGLNLVTTFSLAVWIKRAGTSNGDNSLWSFGGPGNLYILNGDNTLRWKKEGASYGANSTVVDASGWHHVAMVKSGGNITLYLDGVSVGTDVSVPDDAPGTYQAYGWGNAIFNLQPFLGLMDHAAVWNVALSGANVAALAAGTVAPDSLPGLAGFWKFEEGSGTSTNDESANNNDGTLGTAVSWSADVPAALTSDPPSGPPPSVFTDHLCLEGMA